MSRSRPTGSRSGSGNTQAERERATVLVTIGIVGFVLAVLIAFSFGG